MSRLESFLRRLQAQRACLDAAARMIADLPGPVLELGLGNGRTYDHLREILPGREIFVFDRQLAAHPDCIPDEAHMFLGDLRDTLPGAEARIGAPAALAHADIGCGIAEADRVLAAFVGAALVPLLASGAVILADQELPAAGWASLDLPAAVEPGRYFMYLAGAAR